MFFNKSLRKTDKEIMRSKKIEESQDGDAIIEVQIEHKKDVFSAYNYDCDDTLNKELGEFIWHKAKFVPLNKDYQIKLYSGVDLNPSATTKSIKNYFRSMYIEIKEDIKRTIRFAIINILLGLLFLVGLYFVKDYNFYFLNMVIEITAWVLVWEAVDSFFFKRAKFKNDAIKIQKLYKSEIEVIKEDK